MARQAAEQTPEEVARKRLIQQACQTRYYERHREAIIKRRKELYSPEARRKEYLRHQEAEKARTNARRARLRAEAAQEPAAQAEPPEGGNQEAKLGTEPPSTSSGGTVPHLTS